MTHLKHWAGSYRRSLYPWRKNKVTGMLTPGFKKALEFSVQSLNYQLTR